MKSPACSQLSLSLVSVVNHSPVFDPCSKAESNSESNPRQNACISLYLQTIRRTVSQILILYNQNHAVCLWGSRDNAPLTSPCSSGEQFPDGHSCCLLGSPLPAAHECMPTQLPCCRKGDPFQGPRVDPHLTLGYRWSQETHVANMARDHGDGVPGWRAGGPGNPGELLSPGACSLMSHGDGISFLVVFGQSF